jgi:hypothetical protein
MKEVDFNNLKFMRVFTPDHIPRDLVTQIKDKHFDVDEFYAYLKAACVTQGQEGPTLNPFCHLYVIADKNNRVVGFVWFEYNILERSLNLQTFSMDPNYWNKGKAVGMLTDFLKKELKKSKMKCVYWHTKYPKHSEKNGFKRSKNILMEYREEVENLNLKE